MYGSKEIPFRHRVNEKLKHAYITVDFHDGVVLKSPQISEEKANKLVLGKAQWIMTKLKLVEQIPQGDIQTGSRILYLGKRYYAKIVEDKSIKGVFAWFNYSKFTISINPSVKDRTKDIDDALDYFFRLKATEKITPRIKKWCDVTGLRPTGIKFRKLNKRWGSCTNKNEIFINFDVVKLPWNLIDYVIVHELCHLEYKKHSKQFWALVQKYLPNYLERDEDMMGFKL